MSLKPYPILTKPVMNIPKIKKFIFSISNWKTPLDWIMEVGNSGPKEFEVVSSRKMELMRNEAIK